MYCVGETKVFPSLISYQNQIFMRCFDVATGKASVFFGLILSEGYTHTIFKFTVSKVVQHFMLEPHT